MAFEAKYKIFGDSAHAKTPDAGPKSASRPLKHSIFNDGFLTVSPTQESTSANNDGKNKSMKYNVFGNELFWEEHKEPNPSTPLGKMVQAQRPPQVRYAIFDETTAAPTHDIFGHAVKTAPVENKQIKVAAHETAMAAAVVGSRTAIKGVGNVLNFFFPAPKIHVETPKIDPEAVRQENEEALARLMNQYGEVPLSEVGKLPEIVIKRSQIAASASPSRWLEIAEHHVQHAKRAAQQIEAQNASIRAAQEKLQRLAARGPISTDHFMIDPVGVHTGQATNPIDAAYRGWRKRLFRSLTARRLPPGQKDDVLDDSLILDVSNGVVYVVNASRGGRPEPRPLSEIGKGYELKVFAPGMTVGVDTKLKEWGQPHLNTSGWGRVVLEDRMGDNKGKIEVEVPMPSAEQFVELVFEAKKTLEQATKQLDRTMVAVPDVADLLPIPREDKDATTTIFDHRSVMFGGATPDEFFDSISQTQPIRPVRKRPPIIANERPLSENSSLDWMIDEEATREDLPY